MLTLHIIVSGKVQGVFFRVNARRRALELGLAGWVQNMPDGTVKIMATGNEQSLSHFTEWCKRGPTDAAVEEVMIQHSPLQIFESFQIR